MSILLTAAFSYLLGSIPFGFLLLRIFRGQDVRLTGSGNIGATNVARSSPALGLLTLVLDAFKGLAQWLQLRLFSRGTACCPAWQPCSRSSDICSQSGSSSAAVKEWLRRWVDHALAPKAPLVAVGVFVAVVVVFRHVSLGSMLSVALFPVLAWLLRDYGEAPQVLILWRSHLYSSSPGTIRISAASGRD